MSEQREQYSTALTTVPTGDNMSLMQLGEMLSKSGYFQDAKGAAQAIVKVLAGRELGIGPIAAMTGIHIIQGKVGIGANIMAAKVKGSARYDYRVLELTDDVCRVEFLERVGDKLQRLGISEFTKADAILASTKNMDHFPRNMLFARAMSNGVKWFTPDISIAPIYTPDELGATVDYETGEIVDSTATDTTQGNGKDKSDTPSVDLNARKSAFYDKVLREIPYYEHIKHAGNTLRKLGFTGYSIDNEDAMFAALQQHANDAANEAADGKQPEPESEARE